MEFDKIIVISGLLIAFIIFGLFIYLLVIFEKRRRDKLLSNAIKTEGTVEGITFGFHFSYPSFFLKYFYCDQYGNKYQDKKAVGIQAFCYKKGEKIIVCYDQMDPRNTIISVKRKGK